MTFQSTVALQQGAGIPGQLFNDSPRRTQSLILNSADASYNVYGRAFSLAGTQGQAQAGGIGSTPFVGFLVDPAIASLQGTAAGGSLAPTLTLPNYAQGEFLTMGTIFVSLPDIAGVGDLVVFDLTTGALSTISPSANLPVGKGFAFAQVDYFAVSAAGLAVITVSPTFKIPVLA